MTSNKRLLLSIGARVQSLREESKMTQSELAKTMKVSRETLNHWESNSREIKANQVLQLAKLFNVTCDYILQGVSTENVKVYGQTGLSDEAINQLRIVYKESVRGLFPNPPSNIDFFNYMLSNQNFMANFTERLRTYLLKRLDDDDNSEKTKKSVTSEETDTASYLLTRLMQKLADDCYSDFYYPIARGKKVKQKPGRKRKEDVTNGNNAED